MHDLIYSAQESGFDPNCRYENPHYFDGKVTPSKGVLVIGDWPKVVKAYKDAGIPVEIQKTVDGKTAEQPQQQAKNEANDPYPNMTDEQLRSAIEKATGTLPHPNTGRKKLVSMLADADKAANTPVQQATNEVTPQGLNQ